MAEAGKVVLAVGIDDRDGRRQILAELMVVDDDDVEAHALGVGERLVAGVPQSTETISWRAVLRQRLDAAGFGP